MELQWHSTSKRRFLLQEVRETEVWAGHKEQSVHVLAEVRCNKGQWEMRPWDITYGRFKQGHQAMIYQKKEEAMAVAVALVRMGP